MDSSPHLLVVDDDADIRELLAEYLAKYGFTVSTVKNGPDMFAALGQAMPDLVVLDVMLPGEDGLTLCRKLRETSTLPVIFLTALDSGTDRVVGLEIGGDDYVVKPFDPRELLARIRTVLRRSAGAAPGSTGLIGSSSLTSIPAGTFFSSSTPKFHTPASRLCFADWTLVPLSRELVPPDGATVYPTDVLFRLLMAFLEHPFEVLSRDTLLTLTQGRTAEAFDRSIDIQVSRLRSLLKDNNGHEPGLIKTIRGGGYMLAVDVHEERA